MSDDPAYGFAIGRVRSLEGTLLGSGQYDRLLRAAGPTEFAAALQDFGYGRFFDTSVGSNAVDIALDAAQSDYSTFLAQYALDHWLLRVFQLPIDILNLKAAVRASRIGDHEAPFLSGGAWSRDDLAAAVAGEPARLGPGVDAALEPLINNEHAPDATVVDIALDRLEHDLARTNAQPSCFLTAFYGLRADLENARTTARLKASDDRSMRVVDLTLAGGTIGAARWSAAMDGSWDDFPRAVAKSGIEHVVEQGVARFTSTGSLLRWEKVSREAELGFLRASRYAIFGHEPLATFHYFRLNELRNLRGLNAAHRNRMSPDIAQELIAYVD